MEFSDRFLVRRINGELQHILTLATEFPMEVYSVEVRWTYEIPSELQWNSNGNFVGPVLQVYRSTAASNF